MRLVIGLVSAILLVAPAGAAVTVIGSSAARICYEAAKSARVSRDGVAHCDAALADGGMTGDDEVATYVNRGILRAIGGDVGGAASDYDAALARDPGEAEAWLNKGFLMLRTEQISAAVPMFDAAIARKTAEPGLAHYGRAVAHELLGDVRAAYADYRRATELAPAWDVPRAELARFQVRGTGDKRGH